eukprot:1154366-Pelagomonas_calceolata.AAC.3
MCCKEGEEEWLQDDNTAGFQYLCLNLEGLCCLCSDFNVAQGACTAAGSLGNIQGAGPSVTPSNSCAYQQAYRVSPFSLRIGM